jgi:hypothetical protein
MKAESKQDRSGVVTSTYHHYQYNNAQQIVIILSEIHSPSVISLEKALKIKLGR